VVCVGAVLSRNTIPEKYRDFLPHDYAGHSAIIDPFGEVIAGPVEGETVLIADCNLATLRSAKIAFDCAGHSARPDQFKLWNQLASGQDHGQPPDFQQGWSEGGASDQSQFDQRGAPPSRGAKLSSG
jgi:hypothetical protein